MPAAAPLPTLWYENDHGERWMPPPFFPTAESYAPPPGFRFQVSRFPRVVRTTHLEILPNGTSRGLCASESSWPADLVLAMTRPSALERVKQLWRGRRLQPTYPLEQAILRASVACGRCLNLWGYRYGLAWGYDAGAPDDRARTSCELCRALPLPGAKEGT